VTGLSKFAKGFKAAALDVCDCCGWETPNGSNTAGDLRDFDGDAELKI
jgi:hypothetical protein